MRLSPIKKKPTPGKKLVSSFVELFFVIYKGLVPIRYVMTQVDALAKNIAGEITLADHPAAALKKWREIFQVRPSELASALGVSPSVIADYESGRRPNPGTAYIKKTVDALVTLDLEAGGETVRTYALPAESVAIMKIQEFSTPVDPKKILSTLKAKIVANKEKLKGKLSGYTVIDSIQAILTLSEREFSRIYGSTTERALVFTKVSSGRSPMIALRVTSPKPKLVIFHGVSPKQLDPLALKIAEVEKIPLAVSTLGSEQDVVEKLGGVSA